MDRSLQYCTGDSDQNYPKEMENKKAKWLSEGDLQIAEERREVKNQGRKGKIYPNECSVSENSKERYKSLLQ